MGKRRLRDLCHLAPGQVALHEPQPQRCREVSGIFGVPGFEDLEEALAWMPKAFVVSVPPALHDRYVFLAIERGLDVFAELPFLYRSGHFDKLQETGTGGCRLGVSCTLRFYPAASLIKSILDSGRLGKILHLQYTLGYYLPDWHPNEDYRKFYAGDPKAGGAGIDMLFHELSLMQWWLGPVRDLTARCSKLSDLEIQGNDTQDVLLEFETGALGLFHHDVVERRSSGRHIRILGSEGTLEWDQGGNVRWNPAQGDLESLPMASSPDWAEALKASRESAGILARYSNWKVSGDPAADDFFTYESCYLREMRAWHEMVSRRADSGLATLEEERRVVQNVERIVNP